MALSRDERVRKARAHLKVAHAQVRALGPEGCEVRETLVAAKRQLRVLEKTLIPLIGEDAR